MNDVAVLVPSHDGYADIWPIAADLFRRFWPNRQWPIYWMTNGSAAPSIAKPLIVPKIEREEWGNGIAAAMERISEPFILFWVEEILLLSNIPNDRVLEAAEILRQHPDVGLVGLTRYYWPLSGGFGNFAHYRNNDMGFTSALPAIFRRNVLLHLLRKLPQSNDFEQQSHDVMFRDMPTIQSMQPTVAMFRFCDNALLQDRWRQCAVKHLRDMGFNIDFARRGIHPEKCRLMDGAPA